MSGACDACLRRAHLVGALAPRIAGALERRPERPLLALDDERLVAAVAGPGADPQALLAGFEPGEARRRAVEARVGSVCVHEETFPAALRGLPDSPAALFFRGRPGLLDRLREEPAVAVVGSRRPSQYGLETARALGRELAVAGIAVVSGLALGIDAAAHGGALEAAPGGVATASAPGAGGPRGPGGAPAAGLPVAVLAGGPDIPYPRSNRRLYRRLAETGLVLSEMPPGQRAFRWSFPARNRLMAGLAGMTVVVEAAEPSGSLITAEFVGDLGRMVGAVPGRVSARVAAGSNALLRDGAAVIRGAADVLDDLLGAGAGANAGSEAERRRLAALPPELVRVLEAVESGEGIGAVAAAAGIGASQARVALARLEAEGLVVRGPLGSYERAAGATRAITPILGG